jgi:hypothetical protein
MNTNFSLWEVEQKEHFNFKHLFAVGMCSVFLFGLTVMKKGFVLPFSKEQTQTKTKLSYDEIKQKFRQQNNFATVATDKDGILNDRNALATLDPKVNGQVAGASILAGTEALDLQGSEKEVLEAIKNIPIKISDISTQETFFQYIEALENIEIETALAESLSAIANKNDLNNLKLASENLEKLAGHFSNVITPQEFAEYQKLKIFYFGTMKIMAENYLQNIQDENENEILSKYFFATSSLIEKQKNIIQEKFQIALP